MLASNQLRLPHGLQTLEILDVGYLEMDSDTSLSWALPDYYHDHLAKLSILYPSLTAAAIGRYDYYSPVFHLCPVFWVKDRDNHWAVSGGVSHLSSYYFVGIDSSDPDNC